MRIKYMLRALSLLMLCSSSLSSAHIFSRLFGRDGECCAREYTCGPDALMCGGWGLQLHAGVYPVIWHQREDIFQNNCPTTSIFDIGKTPKFRNLFKTPWVVGFQVSRSMSECNDFFLEFNYAQAKNKTVGVNTDCSGCGSLVASNPNFSLVLGKYKLFSGYAGTRYYFDRWCDRAALFLGAKVGVIHHRHINFTQLTAATVIAGYTSAQYFRSNTLLSGGALVGLDYSVCGNWSLMLTAEAVFNCGPRGAGVLALQTTDVTSLIAQNLIIGCVRSEIAFPVTLGVKYNF